MQNEPSHRKELVVFFALLVALSASLDALIIARGKLSSGLVVLAMWNPGVAAIVAVLLFRRSLKPLG